MRFATTVVVIVLSSLATIARADEFEDFRIPPSKTVLAAFGVAASGSRESRSAGGHNIKIGRLDGSATGSIERISDSDPSFTSVRGIANFRGERFRSVEDTWFSDPIASASSRSEQRLRTMHEVTELSVTHRRYPWGRPLGFTIDVAGSAHFVQYWFSRGATSAYQTTSSTLSTEQQRLVEEWDYRYIAVGSVGFGWGRVRNATAVYDALILEQRLIESGALSRRLTPDARRRLAELLHARSAVGRVRDHPAEEVWRAIERLLMDDGSLGSEGLAAPGLLRASKPYLDRTQYIARDALPFSDVLRWTGLFVGPFVSGQHVHAIRRFGDDLLQRQTVNGVPSPETRSHFGEHFSDDRSEAFGGVEGEFHRALGLPWQLDARARVAVPLREENRSLETVSQLDLSWQVADRWLAGANITHEWHDRDRASGATTGDLTVWGYGISISRYLEERMWLTLTARENQSLAPRGGANSEPWDELDRTFTRSGRVWLSLTYRLWGSVDAPGLFPERGRSAG